MKRFTWHKGEKWTWRVWAWIAWRLPRKLVYWAAIRLLSHATVGKYGDQIVPELLAMDALGRWEK